MYTHIHCLMVHRYFTWLKSYLNALIDQGKGKGTSGAGDPDYYEWRRVR
jgi:hypothetical protein